MPAAIGSFRHPIRKWYRLRTVSQEKKSKPSQKNNDLCLPAFFFEEPFIKMTFLRCQ
jgi:hypothetical protein